MSISLDARMAVLSELSLGTAHTLNNALTAIGGEAAFLQSETKDPAVEEACGLILEQVERCARLTHALLRRRAEPTPGPQECELGRVLRDVEALLQDTLPRRLALAVEPAHEAVLVAVPAADAETIVLLLVQHAALRLSGAGSLRLRLDEAPDSEPASLELHSAPAGTPSVASALHERLLRALLSACGGSVTVRPLDGEESARVLLPRLIEGRAATRSSSAGG